MLYTNVDMSQIPDEGELPDAGSYLFRISEVRETDQNGEQLLSEKGEPKIIVLCKIQDEGKFLGYTVQIHSSLQPHALRGLKALYKAVGYTPGPEGHDPQNLVDGEFYGTGTQGEYAGKNGPVKTFNIAPWNIKSVNEGPAKLRS
jgi:hypothetical protein